MTTPTPKPHKLIGTRRGWWYVVALAGQRDGVNLLHCTCCKHGVERLIPEQKLLDRTWNSLDRACRCRGFVGRLTDRVFGLWTVLGPFPPAGAPAGKGGRRWHCRCACRRGGFFSYETLASERLLSCGCRPHAEVRKELEARRWRAVNRWFNSWLRSGREQADKGWTAAMERALRAFQPRCVLCGSPHDLTNHHVHPVLYGHGLRPGNAVRLCRSCNSSINVRDVGELAPETAARLLDAAEKFRAYWEGGCVGAEVYAGIPTNDTPTTPDPAVVAMLRAIEHGDAAGVLSLAAWLAERGDPRAAAIRDVAWLDAEFGAPLVRGDEVSYGVQFTRHGLPCWPEWPMRPTPPGKPEKPPEERMRELLMDLRSREVYERLGLKMRQSHALKAYFGLSPNAPASTVEEMAGREAVQPQTIRNRIDLALHNLAHPAAALRREEQQRRRRELIAGPPDDPPADS